MKQYNLSWVQIVELLKMMSVVTGEGNPYNWAISADQQWLGVVLTEKVLAEDVEPAEVTQVTVDLAPVIPDTPLTAPPAISVTSCAPTTIAITAEDDMLLVTGVQFNPTTQILLGGIVQETIAVSTVELATVFSPAVAPGFGAFEVQVQDGTIIVPPSPSTVTLTVTSATKVTSGTAGLPGAFLPVGNTLPLNLPALTTAAPPITASPATAWISGQYVVLGDVSEASWNGTAWVVGRAAGGTVFMARAEAPMIAEVEA